MTRVDWTTHDARVAHAVRSCWGMAALVPADERRAAWDRAWALAMRGAGSVS